MALTGVGTRTWLALSKIHPCSHLHLRHNGVNVARPHAYSLPSKSLGGSLAGARTETGRDLFRMHYEAPTPLSAILGPAGVRCEDHVASWASLLTKAQSEERKISTRSQGRSLMNYSLRFFLTLFSLPS